MRPSDMLHLIQEQRGALSPQMTKVHADSTVWQVSGVKRLVQALAVLETMSLFRPPVAELRRQFPMLFDGGDECVLPGPKRAAFGPKLDEIRKLADVAETFLLDQVGSEDPLELAVRLPFDSRDADRLQDDIGDFMVILDKIPRMVLGEGITFKRVDTGSSWLLYIAANSDVLALVILIVTAILHLKRDKAKDRETLLALEGKKAYQSVQAELAEDAKKVREEIVRLVLDESRYAMGHEARCEAINLLSPILDKLIATYERGATILLSPTAPKEVIKLAPPEMNSAMELAKQVPALAAKTLSALGPGPKA